MHLLCHAFLDNIIFSLVTQGCLKLSPAGKFPQQWVIRQSTGREARRKPRAHHWRNCEHALSCPGEDGNTSPCANEGEPHFPSGSKDQAYSEVCLHLYGTPHASWEATFCILLKSGVLKGSSKYCLLKHTSSWLRMCREAEPGDSWQQWHGGAKRNGWKGREGQGLCLPVPWRNGANVMLWSTGVKPEGRLFWGNGSEVKVPAEPSRGLGFRQWPVCTLNLTSEGIDGGSQGKGLWNLGTLMIVKYCLEEDRTLEQDSWH